MIFCENCGSKVEAAFCPECGAACEMPPSYGDESVAYAIPATMKWCLMGIAFLFAISTMNMYGGLMLVCVLIPAIVSAYDRDTYDKLKLFLNVGAAGLGLVFAMLATFAGGYIRLQIFAFVLCILGLIFIAIVGLKDMIKLPEQIAKFFSIDESPMYFFVTAIYFALATVFLRIYIDFGFDFGFGLDLFGFGGLLDNVSHNFGAGNIIFSILIVLVLLVPPAIIAHSFLRGASERIGVLLIGLGVSAVFAAVILPAFLRRTLRLPPGYIALGYGGVALVALLLFMHKEKIMQILGISTGSPQQPQ